LAQGKKQKNIFFALAKKAFSIRKAPLPGSAELIWLNTNSLYLTARFGAGGKTKKHFFCVSKKKLFLFARLC